MAPLTGYLFVRALELKVRIPIVVKAVGWTERVLPVAALTGVVGAELFPVGIFVTIPTGMSGLGEGK